MDTPGGGGPYAYKVVNHVVATSWTDIVAADYPGSLTTTFNFGSGTLATSADFSFKHAAVFRVFKNSAWMLREARNSMYGESGLIFLSYGDRKISWRESGAEVVSGLTLNSTSTTPGLLCQGSRKYVEES